MKIERGVGNFGRGEYTVYGSIWDAVESNSRFLRSAVAGAPAPVGMTKIVESLGLGFRRNDNV
jgi:hypothetical protein